MKVAHSVTITVVGNEEDDQEKIQKKILDQVPLDMEKEKKPIKP